MLAAQMGISRSPVREALRRLEQTGLVEKMANRSYRITLLAAEDVPELVALRLADETLAVRTIVYHRYSIDSLDDHVTALEAALGDPVAAATADAAFHRRIVELARLPRLTARYADLTDQIRLMLLTNDIEAWGHGDALVENHTILVNALKEALETGDARGLVHLWEHHVVAGMTSSDVVAPL